MLLYEQGSSLSEPWSPKWESEGKPGVGQGSMHTAGVWDVKVRWTAWGAALCFESPPEVHGEKDFPVKTWSRFSPLCWQYFSEAKAKDELKRQVRG